MGSMVSRVAGALGCVLAPLLVVGPTPAPVTTPMSLRTAPAAADVPRLAFTDDADALYAVTVELEQTEGGEFYAPTGQPTSYATPLSGYAAGPKHEGEAGGTPGSPPAFVSTRDDPLGEVYVDSPGPGITRVTCDPGTETHPVVTTSGAVAYASDADGDWDVYVSSPPPPGVERPAAARSAAVAATACDPSWTTVNVTDAAPGTDDLWPTWTYTPSGGGVVPGGLVFSRAAEAELPDLYLAEQTGGSWAEPTALTGTDDIAETQPAAMISRVVLPDTCDPDGGCAVESQSWVAFTTTEGLSAGTLAFLSPDDPGAGAVTWTDGPGSEPAWSSTVNPTHLAFTSTERDPYGGVGVARAVEPTASEGAGTSAPEVDEVALLTDFPSGVAESHPFWLDPFGSGEGDDEATLVYTSRSRTDVAPGSRILASDVADVRALDGSQRRVIRSQRDPVAGEVVHRYDEAGPAFSPDGLRIVYSRDADPASEVPGTRVLMVADADGTDAAPLLPASQRQPLDTDVDPTWSPDGRKIAFVRVRGHTDRAAEPAEARVFDLDTQVVTRILGTLMEGPRADLSPSWAPDSRHLVLARSEVGGGSVGDAARRWGENPVNSSPRLHIVDITEPGGPGTGLDYCSDGCVAFGRSPAWSPDGSRIVYEDDGQLRMVTLPDPCCTGPVVDVDPPVAVTGFETFDGEDPTPSRPVVSAASDPAWSPDGAEIAFAGQPVGQPDQRGIWRIAPDGTGLRLITDGPGPETEPAYQPDPVADVAVTVSVVPGLALVGSTVVATFTVTNEGPAPAAHVVLDTTFSPGAARSALGGTIGCRADGSGCGFALLAPGESRVYQVRVRHEESVLGTATGTVGAGNPDPDLTDNTASAPYRFQAPDVRVRVRLDEPIGYVGGLRTARVTVRNIGADPVADVSLTATWPDAVVADVPPPLPSATPGCLPAGAACDLGTLGAGASRSFRVALQPLVAGLAPITAAVTTSTAEMTTENNVDTVDLEILQPTIRVLPSVAPPGKVVLAYGESMPPDSEISLEWAIGISIHRGPFEVSQDGTTRVPVLIVRHDLLGTRPITATSTEDLFSPVEAEMLVVPRTLMPPNFAGRG